MGCILESQGYRRSIVTDKTEIYFKNFTLLDDAELRQVYEWRNLDYIRLKMDNPQIFPFEEHLKFCRSLSSYTDKIYFQVSVGGVPCAVLDFVDIDRDQKSAESGFYVIKEYNHYASAISRVSVSVCIKLGIDKVRARILKNNEKAIFYNLIKLRSKYVGEDEKYVYCEHDTYKEALKSDPIFKHYSFRIDL